MPPHWPRRGQYTQKRHQDGGSGGYSYDSSSPTGYRNSSGDVVSWWVVYHSYILPNAVRGVTIGVEEYYYQGRGTQFGNDAIRVNPNGNLHVWAVFTSTFYGVVGFAQGGGGNGIDGDDIWAWRHRNIFIECQ